MGIIKIVEGNLIEFIKLSNYHTTIQDNYIYERLLGDDGHRAFCLLKSTSQSKLTVIIEYFLNLLLTFIINGI